MTKAERQSQILAATKRLLDQKERERFSAWNGLSFYRWVTPRQLSQLTYENPAYVRNQMKVMVGVDFRKRSGICEFSLSEYQGFMPCGDYFVEDLKND